MWDFIDWVPWSFQDLPDTDEPIDKIWPVVPTLPNKRQLLMLEEIWNEYFAR